MIDFHISKEIHINCDDFHQQHGSTFADGNNQLTTTLGSRLWAKRSRSTTWRCEDGVYYNAGKHWLLVNVIVIWIVERKYEIYFGLYYHLCLGKCILRKVIHEAEMGCPVMIYPDFMKEIHKQRKNTNQNSIRWLQRFSQLPQTRATSERSTPKSDFVSACNCFYRTQVRS